MGHSELRQQKLKVNVIVAREVKSVVGERVDFVILGQILIIFAVYLRFCFRWLCAMPAKTQLWTLLLDFIFWRS